jgi:hypothetical protein
METVLGSIAVGIGVVATVPYVLDIIRGRVTPSRSSRVMLELLLVIALYQQIRLGAGWGMAVTIGELVSCGVLLFLAMPYGVGGWQRSDIICYLLLAIDLLIWWQTGSALYGLCLTMLADFIAFWPTLYKTWKLPNSETQLWYWSGVVASSLSVIAAGSMGLNVVFPLYLAAINLAEVLLITRLRWWQFSFGRIKRYTTSI